MAASPDKARPKRVGYFAVFVRARPVIIVFFSYRPMWRGDKPAAFYLNGMFVLGVCFGCLA